MTLPPAGGERGLVTVPAWHARAAVAGAGRQQFPEQAGPELQHPGADHRLRRIQVGIAAAQHTGGLRRKPS
jgi:hypothetical protein